LFVKIFRVLHCGKQEKGILLDYFIYPGHDHNVAGKDRAHLIKKIEDYFERNL